MSKVRKQLSAEQRAQIVRRHVADKVPVSDLADEFGVQPSQIHIWVKQVLDQAENAFNRIGRPFKGEQVKSRQIQRLEAKLAQKNEVIAELLEENVRAKKSQWGALKGRWVPHDTRDAVVDYVNHWTMRSEFPAKRLLHWLGLGASKFHDWRKRYGKVNEHNALVPRDEWLEAWEKKAILDFHDRNPLEGYRRLCFMMLDQNIVAVSPSSVYRVLKQAGRLDRRWLKPSKKGTGFVQPLLAHQHWHLDISYINVAGTFYYLCSLLDGYSRYLVHWELRESMTEKDVETIVQRALEKYPAGRPRIITDNGPQFIARDFKEFIRLTGITHVRTSPYYPQSNGKLERWHGSLKRERLRTAPPGSVEEARSKVAWYVEYYNQKRLHSALAYITPADKLAGREQAIYDERDRKLEEARARRAAVRQAARLVA